jgi:hypothetical protein
MNKYYFVQVDRRCCTIFVKPAFKLTSSSNILATPLEDVDIIYALGSIDKNHGPLFEIQKNITKAIVEQQSSPETKHGLIVFGKDTKEVSPLENFKNEPEFVEKLERLKWPSEAKRLAPPFEKGSQIFKEHGNNTTRVMILIEI